MRERKARMEKEPDSLATQETTHKKSELCHLRIGQGNCIVLFSGSGRRQRVKFLATQNENMNHVIVGFHGGPMAVAKVSQTESHTENPAHLCENWFCFLLTPPTTPRSQFPNPAASPQQLLHESHKRQLCFHLLFGPWSSVLDYFSVPVFELTSNI